MLKARRRFLSDSISDKALRQFARGVCLLHPIPVEVHMRGVDYIYWAILGGKWRGDPAALRKHFPDPLALVAPMRAARSVMEPLFAPAKPPAQPSEAEKPSPVIVTLLSVPGLASSNRASAQIPHR